ncbi:MFS transporter [Nocardiopsis sp. L17-MgMaSL7]|uniref:MFS transporter n=1 Tax=Nocardiopsis sp. L17-MgMaSL7 TaxID=1938893 RepID=UPI000D71C893|nr:MFS transporter [Nocardiopsis sp. L17-MgMaSL7]PWV49399.1 EmrB/QacA subfamily drug resistance transporter [Nocardiopsis sp. L17-MgMaSL7]
MHHPSSTEDTGAVTPRSARPGIVLTVVSLGAAIVALDGTVISVANPDIAADLQPTLSGLQWVTNAYLLAIASTLVVFGRAADRYSRKGFWLTGIGLFTFSSLMIALSTSINTLILWRVVQGLAGALIMPAGVGLLRATFSGPALSRALAIWSGCTAIAAAAGPVVAGLLVQIQGWQSVFLINVPIGVLALILGVLHLRDQPGSARSGGLDTLGALLLALAMVSLAWGVLQAEHGHIGADMLLYLGSAVVLGALFVWRQRRAAEPLLDLSVFANRTVPAAALLVVLAFFTLYGTLFFLTLYMQRVQGASAFEAGMQVMPLTAALAVASALVGQLNARVGPRPALLIGMAIVAVSAFGLSQLQVESTYHALWPWLIGMGLGIGMVSVASTDALVSNVRPELSSVAGGLQQTASQMGGVMGTAVLTTLLSTSVAAGLAGELSAREVAPEQAQFVLDRAERVSQGEVPVPEGTDPATVEAIVEAGHTTFVAGMTQAMSVAVVMALIGMVAALLVRRGEHSSEDTVVMH